MAKIQNETDIIKWAEGIVSANGEKFTPLSKGEQFLIAKYILERRNTIGERNMEAPIDGTNEIAEDSCSDTTAEEQKKNKPSKEPSVMRMTRGAVYNLAGMTAQNAYDEYLNWIKDHPTEKDVMDFSTGRKSESAAFAYWLSAYYTV